MSYANLGDWCADIADAIRAKDGTLGAINHADFPARIAAIQTGLTIGDFLRHDYDKNPLIIDGPCSIDQPLFTADTSLISVIGTEVTGICAHAFEHCDNLQSIDFREASIIDDYAFAYCSSLTSVAENTYGVGLNEHVFDHCVSLTQVTFRSCSIGKWCFFGCGTLQRVHLKNRCDSIDQGAFSLCSNLDTLIIEGTTVPTLTDTIAFGGTKIEDGTGYIYVDDSMVTQYQQATNWSQYAAQIRPISDLGGA